MNGGPSLAASTAASFAPPSFGFDPRSLEIKTKSVEQTLAPLVQQV